MDTTSRACDLFNSTRGVMGHRTSQTKLKTDSQKKSTRSRRLRVTNPHAADVDVQSDIHWMVVPPEDASPPPDHPANLPPTSARSGLTLLTCTNSPTGSRGAG
jgi:hypothetical protein